MAISLKHTFQSAKADGADTTLVQPSNWNAEHIITAAAGKVLGRDTSGAGAVQELPIAVDTSGNVALGGALSVDGNTTLGDAAGDSVTINASTVNLPNGATFTGGTLNFGGAGTGTVTYSLGSNATASGNTKTINLGTGGVAGSTTTVNIGATAGTVTVFLNGNILSGNTTNDSGTGGRVFIKETNGNACVSTFNTAANSFCYAARVATTNSYFGWFNYNTTTVGSIGTNGTSTSYNTTSDARLKENIQDAGDAGALIDAIRVRQFDWRLTGEHQRYGAIAQELLTVFPEAVHVPGDPEQMMGVDFSTFVPALIKEVQALRARVAALEARP